MAKVGAQRAAELTGKSRSTIQRAMNNGKLSCEKDENDRRVIDVSELERVYGLVKSVEESPHDTSVQAELQRASEIIEKERMQMRIRILEDQVHTLEQQLEDVRGQRDQWQKQAQQVLLTSQYSQEQAKELKEEIRDRDRREKLRRQKMEEQKSRRLQGNNENTRTRANGNAGSAGQATNRGGTNSSQGGQDDQGSGAMLGLWNKILGKSGRAA